MPVNIRTNSAEGTQGVAAAIAPLLRAGDLLVLSGDLGGGKTAFVQGLAASLGVSERVTSPTFTLAHTYEGRLRVHHLDVYRVDSAGDVMDLNLPELLDDNAVVVIEWGERILAQLPGEYLLVRFALGGPEDSSDVRVLELRAAGTGWEARFDAIQRALPRAGSHG